MTPILDSAALSSDLDANNFRILNLGKLLPPPPNLVGINDPVMSNARQIPDGSVTNDSVAVTAGITQDKLLLDGSIPTPWLGTGSNQAAQGDLVERGSNKDIPNGYAGADDNGLIPEGVLNPGIAAGSANTVYLMMPPELPISSGNPIKDSDTFVVDWADVPNESWFGVTGFESSLLSSVKPGFLVSRIPLSLIPGLDASKVTSGVFNQERFPVCIGLGVDHSLGFVPDPGQYGDSHDYLGRDMEWHTFTQNQSYQPTVPDVLIQINSDNSVTIRSTLKGSTLFYRTGANFVRATPGTSDVKITLPILINNFVQAYASKPGYNNSPIASLVIP